MASKVESVVANVAFSGAFSFTGDALLILEGASFLSSSAGSSSLSCEMRLRFVGRGECTSSLPDNKASLCSDSGEILRPTILPGAIAPMILMFENVRAMGTDGHVVFWKLRHILGFSSPDFVRLQS